ncbi:MAG: glycosyl transferase family 2 [uncultured bacterium]|nr:MAG: glycosyl transferase family 2 [uncultured bacterium]
MVITISRERVTNFVSSFQNLPLNWVVIEIAVVLSVMATLYFFVNDQILLYGDAESHINIAKRVVDGITPGMAQLGGVWLPLPHLLMLPFVKFDFMWRSGLAGSIVSGISYVIASLYIYKFSLLLIKSKMASFLAFLLFALNPNILYLQSTPLTEMPLIVFFVLSSYYFTQFVFIALQNRNQENAQRDKEFLSLILAAFFAFCASLTRYDGWFLVVMELVVIVLIYLPTNRYKNLFHESKFKSLPVLIQNKFFISRLKFERVQGMAILFSTLAFFGIFLWLMWDFMILGDPLYFTNSQFSAKSQQQNWLNRGQLPAYHNPGLAFMYYFVDSMSNVGMMIFLVALVGLFVFNRRGNRYFHFLITLILLAPFIFNVLTLYLGQSIIFIPHLTPVGFDWRLFNARYGVMMVPFAAFFVSYLFMKSAYGGKILIVGLCLLQGLLFGIGYSKVLAYADGYEGLSSAKRPDAERWLLKNYDGGLVLIDDFSRATSIVRSGIPMQRVIYIGNKPYWQESLKEPEKYAKWIVIQKEDDLWRKIYTQPDLQGRLYKHFVKAYTSPDILIFKRNY